ncbi:MAG: 3-phosphoshikimate 1-carboxyvinyltransferase [Pseudomonadota bacterium]
MTSFTARPGGSLSGIVAIPGDKSCSHRALILSAMAEGISTIANLGESEDVLRTVTALQAFGIEIVRDDEGRWRVTGGQWQSPKAPIDCGNSGTTARLLIGAVAGMPGVHATFVGDTSLSKRPMKRVVTPLERMGAGIEGGETLPLTIEGVEPGGIEYSNVPASAQVKSAILLAGIGGSAPVLVVEPVPSRHHSEIMLGQFGCAVTVTGGEVELGVQRNLQASNIMIAADPSAAAFPLVGAAIVPGSEVTVKGMLVNPLRTGLCEALEEMGARIALANERIVSGEIVADVTVGHGRLQGITIPASRIPAMIDEIPALAIAAAMADGETLIEGLAELRVKESDRLGAILAGLVACGATALADSDSLRILGRGKVRGGDVLSQSDHRIAMAFLTLGLASDGPVTMDDGDCVATSFPGFVESMCGIGANIE